MGIKICNLVLAYSEAMAFHFDGKIESAVMVHAKYNLSWQTYSEHLRGIMSQMMTTTEFADVTLVSEDRKYIKAHRNILSACSPVLKDILSIDKSSSTIIYLRGIQYSELECILHYFSSRYHLPSKSSGDLCFPFFM